MWSRFLLSALVVLFPMPTLAAVMVSEIMYDLPGSDEKREWVEVWNEGPGEIDLSSWKFLENDVNHKLVPVGTSLIPANGYAVVVDDAAKFRADWPAFSGILFESSFSLGNTGETIALKDASSIIVSATYSAALGAAGDGNSLNAAGASWRPSAPTPGASASASAIVVTPKVAVTPEPKVISNREKNTEVIPPGSPESDEPALPAESASLAAVAEASPTPVSEGENPFGILPWITGLLAVMALGVGALLFGKRKETSGYTIIEEKQ